ncbi:hypothetical protein [Parachryseolinea silvisoli]|jgi:hypothetical protein|uniref:hypothetical protein n=1 Tax=Parachryseolinea silvisoli TaxID=2873601 RepID=UPI002265B37F|nr:hypothetical protein [Parachryseolinea silvisoli]MCD9018912.1 hypothetical protein [Parachryseolinea silvisoli]
MYEQVDGYSLTIVRRYPQADICTVAGHPDTVVVRAMSTYIPLMVFQIIFQKVVEMDQVREGQVTTVVFDKRKLMVYHQPSMEWYFLTWKATMLTYGVTRHRKLLPVYAAFRTAAGLGKEALFRDHPAAAFQRLDIGYVESLREALES